MVNGQEVWWDQHAGESWVGANSERQSATHFPQQEGDEGAGLCGQFIPALFDVFLFMEKIAVGLYLNLQSSSLGFSHPSQ